MKPQATDQVAPLLQQRNQLILPGQINDQKHYSLRCTDGDFKGRFLYINLTDAGELFGSADPETNEEVTMYIENAGLSPYHASIRVTDANGQSLHSTQENPLQVDYSLGHYMLYDRDSESGTWVHIKHSYCQHQNWILPNLLDESERIFRAGDSQFTFSVDQSTRIDLIDIFFNLPQLRDVELGILNYLKQCNFKTVNDLIKSCNYKSLKESGAKR